MGGDQVSPFGTEGFGWDLWLIGLTFMVIVEMFVVAYLVGEAIKEKENRSAWAALTVMVVFLILMTIGLINLVVIKKAEAVITSTFNGLP